MLTDTMNHEEVIHEIEKDLPQVLNYFESKNFIKLLTKKIGKRKVKDPIEYKELYISKNNIEWGIHAIAEDNQTYVMALYALHRCKNGIAAYKYIPEHNIEWQIFSSHFFDQYYERFLQYEFDDPLHKKEVIQEFMRYNTAQYDLNSSNDAIEGLLSASSRQRLEEEGTAQTMGALEDGIGFGFMQDSRVVYTTFISYEMIRDNQKNLVEYLKMGLYLLKKGFCAAYYIEHDKHAKYYIKDYEADIIRLRVLQVMLGLHHKAEHEKMTEEEAIDFLIEQGEITANHTINMDIVIVLYKQKTLVSQA